MHVRQQVRDAVVARLFGLTLTGPHVFKQRLRPVDQANLPCILVNTDEEEVLPATIHSTIARQLVLTIRCMAQGTDGSLDDTLDEIAEDVEAELGNGTPILVGASEQLLLTAVGVEFDTEGEKPAGALTLTYRYEYFTTTAAPGTAL
jgi:hypothetical protein